jgi:hypothetical protein
MSLLQRLFGPPRHVSPPSGGDCCQLPDTNVMRVRAALLARSESGHRKYGTTTDRTDIDLAGWLQHLQEELLDAAVYVERLKEEIRLYGDTHRGQ